MHDYEKMPPLYQFVYYKIRFYDGPSFHKFVSNMLRCIKNKKLNVYMLKECTTYDDQDNWIDKYIKKGVSDQEVKQLELLSNYKYTEKHIHSNFQDFCIYINKTKKTTNVELRKKIRCIIHTDFIHAFSQEEVTRIKSLFKEINIDEIMEEINNLVEIENKRIETYQKESPKRKKTGSRINKLLLEIAPPIIAEVRKKNNFFSNLDFSKDEVGFFIKSDIGKDMEIINEYLKKAIHSEQLFIELDEDNENYFISFSGGEYFSLGFMQAILGQRYLKEPLEGFKILGIPIQVIIRNCQYGGISISEPEWHEINFNKYYESIKNGIFAFGNRLQIKSYTHESIRFVIEELMKKTQFNSELYLACYLHYNFLLPMKNYAEKRQEFFEKNNILLSGEEVTREKEKIYKKLLLNGKVTTKWKNERDLFKLITKNYPDAIFQYRADWLERQSLDIYVPSIKTAFEYQGQQHYEPIDFFGGKEGFLYRQKLDAIKKDKCKKNDIRLIDWHYKDVISKATLKRKLNF